MADLTPATLLGFAQNPGVLTLDERRLITEQALILFEDNYVHLPEKAAMYGVNPVQQLRLLHNRLERQTDDTMPPEWQFHAEMSEIFYSVHDLHTTYVLPEPFAGKLAFLPFLIEEYADEQGSHYVVTHIASGFVTPGFNRGTEVTHWNGVPVATAVDLHAARFAGSNPAARHSRGLESLTLRPLSVHLPPAEEWVTISYLDPNGANQDLRLEWRIADTLAPPVDLDQVTPAAMAQGIDAHSNEITRAKLLLFAPRAAVSRSGIESAEAANAGTALAEIPTPLADCFRARVVTTPSGTFGHLRIFTFATRDAGAFVTEFIRLLGLLPQNGLVIDLRDNGGGSILAAESLLQSLTPRTITPEPAQFRNTPRNLRICQAHRDDPKPGFGPWLSSMEQSTQTGATMSNAFPLSPPAEVNALGQQYEGPVVLVTNARCYSATDIFAGGFQDHEIGTVLGVDDNTGAGGANMWTHAVITALSNGLPASPYTALPKGAGMRVAMRRTLRVGPQSGTQIEDLGVVPDQLHRMTKRDVLQDNQDLLARAGELLQATPPRVLALTVVLRNDGALKITADLEGIDRLDVYLDARPRASVDVTGRQAEVTVPDAGSATTLRMDGFAAGRLVAGRSRQLPKPTPEL